MKLQDDLEKGDSGSWIHDVKTGEVYGYLIAGSPGTGFGYIVPMVKVLEDLRARFPGIWQILKPDIDGSKAYLPLSRPPLQVNHNTELKEQDDMTHIISRLAYASHLTF